MCDFVREHLFNWTYQPRFYKQYRDDSFGICLHGESTLLQYLEHINTLHPSIKFTLTYGKQIHFLDLILTLTNWGSIQTETFYKPTDTFQFLDAHSCHPPSIIKNIPKSHFRRHMRNCSTFSTFLKHAYILKFNLRKRSYTKKLINNKLRSLPLFTRSKILKYNTKSKLKRTPLIITYNSNPPDLEKIIRENMPVELKSNRPLLG